MSIIKRPIKEFSKKELEESFWQLTKELDKWAEKEGIVLGNDETYILKGDLKRSLLRLHERANLSVKEVSP